jgi:Fe-S cluster assembly ATPase SufC
VAAQRVVYHVARTDLLRAGCGSEPNVHLVDVGRGIDSLDDVDRWVEARRDAGDAVILATRDADAADALASRVLLLRRGAIVPSGTRRIRVAEPASS